MLIDDAQMTDPKGLQDQIEELYKDAVDLYKTGMNAAEAENKVLREEIVRLREIVVAIQKCD